MLATRLAAKREAAEGSKLVDRRFRRLAHQDSDSDDDDDERAISSYDRTQQARRNFQRRRAADASVAESPVAPSRAPVASRMRLAHEEMRAARRRFLATTASNPLSHPSLPPLPLH